ncbi:MAG: sensor histidine kinase, partial [Cyclobacteriaceae bacterium]|nr:sensor histidine kinase [Cyclobacteriaceae bacterium]
ALAVKGRYRDLEAEALNHIGVTHEAQGNYSEALAYEQKALAIRRELGDDSKTANTLNTLGIIHDEKGDYQQALEYYFDARKIYERLGDEGKIAMVLTNIGIVFRAQNDWPQAAEYYAHAMRLYTKLNNRFGMAACHSNLGALYLNMGKYDSAILYSLKAAREFEEQKIWQFLPTSLSNAASAYYRRGEWKKATEYFEKARAYHARYENKKELSFTLSQLARAENQLGDRAKALDHADESLRIAEDIMAWEQIMQAREALSEVKAGMKDYRAAFQEQKLFMAAKDTLFRKEKAKQLMELQTQYDTEVKDRRISDLDKDNQLKAATIERNYFLMGGLLALLMLGIALFYVWKMRHARLQEQVLSEQKIRLREAQITAVIESQEKERKRFASDLHDGMGQLMAALQLNIQSLRNAGGQPDKRDVFFEGSEQLIREMHAEIRNIAFNLMPMVLVKEGLLPAVKELARKINKSGKIAVTVSAFDLPERFDEVVEVSVYRIIQELLSNIIKHASATEVSVSFTGYDDEVILTLGDNGIGYDLEKFMVSEGNGWRNIHSRLQLIRATIEFDVVKGRQNNTVVITLPKISRTTPVTVVENTEQSV